MVRIVKEEKTEPVPKNAAKLDGKSQALLHVIGIAIADNPKAIQELLEEYGVELSESFTNEELTDKLLSAISENNPEFNGDLAHIILDCTLESNYDSFDFKSLFNKGGDSEAEDGGGASGGGGGLVGGIANAIGGISGAIGQGIKGRQAKDQATAQTLQGIYEYKAQLAANAQSKSKTKRYVLIGLFSLLGLALMAFINYMNKQSMPTTEELKV